MSEGGGELMSEGGGELMRGKERNRKIPKILHI
jgi:hypothetical protein